MNPEKADQIRQDAMMDAYRESVSEKIKHWFLQRYEDPAHNTPYDSGEGGYLYQWGGPYDARDVLHDEFRGEVEEEIIDEVADELEGISSDWERIPTLEDIDPDDIAPEFLARFRESLASVRTEVAKLGEKADPFMCSLLFAHAITSLEAYLSDAFLTCIKNPKHFRAFVESDPELKNEKLAVSEIYKKLESLQGDALKRIQSIVFHRLEVVQRMYKDTLGIELPPGMKDLIPAVMKRHDIIHRACKDKDGKLFVITKGEVEALVNQVDAFIQELDKRIAKIVKA